MRMSVSSRGRFCPRAGGDGMFRSFSLSELGYSAYLVPRFAWSARATKMNSISVSRRL